MIDDEKAEKVAREYDRECAAQIGEPSPWDGIGDEAPEEWWKRDRIAAMRAAIEAGGLITPEERDTATTDLRDELDTERAKREAAERKNMQQQDIIRALEREVEALRERSERMHRRAQQAEGKIQKVRNVQRDIGNACVGQEWRTGAKLIPGRLVNQWIDEALARPQAVDAEELSIPHSARHIGRIILDEEQSDAQRDGRGRSRDPGERSPYEDSMYYDPTLSVPDGLKPEKADEQPDGEDEALELARRAATGMALHVDLDDELSASGRWVDYATLNQLYRALQQRSRVPESVFNSIKEEATQLSGPGNWERGAYWAIERVKRAIRESKGNGDG